MFPRLTHFVMLAGGQFRLSYIRPEAMDTRVSDPHFISFDDFHSYNQGELQANFDCYRYNQGELQETIDKDGLLGTKA